MRISLTLLLICLCIAWLPKREVMAQEHVGCGTEHAMQKLYQNRPQDQEAAKQFDEYSRMFANQSSNARMATSTYTIPVVFHVFGTDFVGQTVDVPLIEKALQEVSDDFRGLSNVTQQVSSQFAGIQETLDIEFKLAKIDPDGNPTTGVTFNPVASGFGNGSGYDSQIQQYAWDNYKYANVYIMLDLYNDGGTTSSGVAWYPNTWMSDNNLARVVYNGRYISDNTSENFRRVLTHEFGHYLNLIHTFEGGCSGGDEISDTPATTSNSGSCNYTVEKCPGAGPANGENFMDYSNCYRMFTVGQVQRMEAALQHPSRQTLWQPSNLAATGVGGIGAHVFLANSSFTESADNNGSIDDQSAIEARDGATFAVTGSLTEGVHYTTSGIPSGLSVQLNVSNSTNATISITGSASSHGASASTSNASITFLDAAISGGVSSIFSPTLSMSFNFLDPFQIVYDDIADMTANSSSTWTYFTIQTGDAFGVWYSDGDLRFETYQKSMVCEGSTRNLSRVAYGEVISNNSNFVAGGAHPNQHNLRTSSHTIWDGQSGYLGFQIQDAQGRDIVGWFRISVTANGSSYTLYDYAYNEDPNGSILAGQTSAGSQNPPVAEFTANSTTIDSGQSVSFSDQSTNSPTTWNWTFEGGNPTNSTDQNPTVVYSDAGTYRVTLQAGNNAGSDTEIKEGFITVNEAQINYCASSSNRSTYEWISEVQVGGFTNSSGASNYTDFTAQTVNLNAGQSSNISLTPGFRPNEPYNEWFKVWIDYNRDGTFDNTTEVAFNSGGTSQTTVSGQISVPANATIGETRMRVTMRYNSEPSPCGSFADGEVEDYTVNIQEVSGTPPVTDFIASATTITVGESISFTDQSTESPTSWSWTFESGSPTNSSVQNPTVTFNTPGTFNISLTASNASGSDTKTVDNMITVNQVPAPVADFTASPTTITVGQSVDFSDASSNSPTSWSWSFDGGNPSSSSNQNPSVTYNTPGVYQVSLAATNDGGSDIETKSSFITVNAIVPVAEFTANATTIAEGQSVSFSDQSTNTPTSWSWAFEGGNPVNSTDQNPIVSYDSPGVYTVTLTSANSAGSDVESKTGYITVEANQVTYCSTQGGANYEFIESVAVGGFSNTSSGVSAYTDFTNMTVPLASGSSSSISLTPGFVGNAYTEFWKVWIDFNKNGSFDDAGEEVFSGNGNSTIGGTINVPSGLSGRTRMRVSMKYNAAPVSCGDFGDGEAEDYTVDFDAPVSTAVHSGVVSRSGPSDLLPPPMTLIYPNPGTGQFVLETRNNVTNNLIEVIDINGRIVHSLLGTEHHTEVDITGLKSGVYTIRLFGERETLTDRLVLKQ